MDKKQKHPMAAKAQLTLDNRSQPLPIDSDHQCFNRDELNEAIHFYAQQERNKMLKDSVNDPQMSIFQQVISALYHMVSSGFP